MARPTSPDSAMDGFWQKWQLRRPHFLNSIKYILLISVACFLTWYKILNQVPLGEGYYYFNDAVLKIDFGFWSNYDLLAKIIFRLLIPIFQDNLVNYMWFQLLTALAVYTTMFLVLSKITKDRIWSFTSTIFFLASFLGSSEMMAVANYQRFVQRVPNLIGLWMAFYFLNKFIKTNKLKNVSICLFFYFLSFVLAHHSSFMMPLFIFYSVVSLFRPMLRKQRFSLILCTILFIIIPLQLTKGDGLKPKIDPIRFIQSQPQVIEKTLLQLPQILIPQDLIIYGGKKFVPPIGFPYVPMVRFLVPPIFVFMIITSFWIWKKNNSMFNIYVTSFLSIIGVAFLNVYAYDGFANPLVGFGQDRTYFIPSIFSAMIFATLIKMISGTNKKLYKFLATIVLLIFMTNSVSHIWKEIDDNQYKSIRMRNFISYIKPLANELNPKSIIITHSSLMWPLELIAKFYSEGNIRIYDIVDNWQAKVKDDPKSNVWILDYDFKTDKITRIIYE